jgi:hypothetical protein
MRFEVSAETKQVMKSPVAQIAILLLVAAALVLVFQIIQRMYG